MHKSFGMHARPISTRWEDIRKGPSLDAVREHVKRIGNHRGTSANTAFDPER